jgi:AraC-like DNA-binding protein
MGWLQMLRTEPSVRQADFEEALNRLAVERDGRHLLHAAASLAARRPRASQPQHWLYSHTSTGVELACGQRGTALIVTPAQTYRLTRAKLIAIELGVQHAELPGRPDRGHSVFWCHLFQTRAHLARSTFSPSRGLVTQSLDLPGSTNLERVGQAVCRELSSRSRGYEGAVSSLLTYLSCLISRRIHRYSGISADVSEFSAPADGRRQWEAIQAALGFCQARFREGVLRHHVAAAVGYSPSHLGYLFSSYLGYSISEFLLNLRVAEATRLLEESDLTVSGIASAVGYSDPAHFTRAFKRAVGTSPAAYRQQLEPL